MESPPVDVEKMDTPFKDSSSTSELSATQEGVTAAYEAKSTLSKHPLALVIFADDLKLFSQRTLAERVRLSRQESYRSEFFATGLDLVGTSSNYSS
jgi:hypothetical protein